MNPLDRRQFVNSGLLLGVGLALTGCATYKKDPRIGTLPPQPTRRPRTPMPGPSPAISGVISRREWTSAQPDLSNSNPMGTIERITVHHEGSTPVSFRGKAEVADRLEQIRKAHLGRGWADIGYHYIIDPQGRVWEGRPIRLQGAHVKDHNPGNLGVMVLGNFEEQKPTSEALATLDGFIAAQMRRLGVPLARVHTHQELMPTACPGRNLQAYMLSTRARNGRLARA